MKRNTTRTLTLTLALILLTIPMLLSLTACGKSAAGDELWADALYREDTTLGEGGTTVLVEVEAGDKSVTFTLKTDRTILGDALTDHRLIEGEEGAYGLYVKKVNGITADYDTDGHYWSLCSGGKMLDTGVDTTEIADGAHYELVYAK